MRNHKLALVLASVVILFSILPAGCEGITGEQNTGVDDQLIAAKEQITALQNEAQKLKAEKAAVAAQLQTAQDKIAGMEEQISGLESQVSGLKEQYELVGATKTETAENIVRYYHETHVYSSYDLFVCSDMASEVWNMLKAQGIDADIIVGNKDKVITDVLQSNHAWVRAEVAPGEYLALEATEGTAVPKSENALYYRGWSFDSPKELKRHNELVQEYNVMVDVINLTSDKAQEVAAELNKATNQTEAGKLKAVYDELMELINAQEAKMKDIRTELNSLATRCGT
jgi:predicted  nucleic acid-binding Zn-ribbon protein